MILLSIYWDKRFWKRVIKKCKGFDEYHVSFAGIYYNLYYIKAFTKQDKVKRRRQLAFAKFQLNATCLSRLQIDLSFFT